MGLESRRRYRWQRGQINDYWDEVFTADGLAHSAALDDQTVNYRTPQPVMAEAEPVILTALPDAHVPTSIRTDGQPVTGEAVVLATTRLKAVPAVAVLRTSIRLMAPALSPLRQWQPGDQSALRRVRPLLGFPLPVAPLPVALR